MYQKIAYIKGASADPWVNIIKPPKIIKKIIMGASHHFFLTLRKDHSSDSIDSLLICFFYLNTLVLCYYNLIQSDQNFITIQNYLLRC
jgi:hypothetical protein